MTRSLGMTAYRAMARRANARFDAPVLARPKGELIWIHAGEAGNLLAVRDLAKRLMSQRTGARVLISMTDTRDSTQIPDALIETRLPSEHPTAIKGFLDHWAPDLCVWVWGMLRPNLLLETAKRECPMFLIDADAGGIDHRRDRWLPDVTREILAKFQKICTRSEKGQRRVQQLGVAAEKVEQVTPLMAGGEALSCTESDLTDLSAAMGGRPAWFASHVLPLELPIVLEAHKHASRLSHRLLLILQPASAEDTQTATLMAAEQNMQVADWDNGDFPDETTQVLISSTSADRGLFFRLAPVSFLGSTLFPGSTGCDPLDAAALGSAVLYGPKVRDHMPSYTRLAAAGAARIVKDADTLGTSISRLIAPDQAATMAHAGWDVISQGAALTDTVVEMVQDALDQKLRQE